MSCPVTPDTYGYLLKYYCHPYSIISNCPVVLPLYGGALHCWLCWSASSSWAGSRLNSKTLWRTWQSPRRSTLSWSRWPRPSGKKQTSKPSRYSTYSGVWVLKLMVPELSRLQLDHKASAMKATREPSFFLPAIRNQQEIRLKPLRLPTQLSAFSKMIWNLVCPCGSARKRNTVILASMCSTETLQ